VLVRYGDHAIHQRLEQARELFGAGTAEPVMASHSRRDSLIERAAESLRRSERSERLRITVAEFARELAHARRQITDLKRENAALRAQLAKRRGKRITPLRRPNRVQPRTGIGGRLGG